MDLKYFLCDRVRVQIEEPFDFPEDESVAISDVLRSKVFKMMRGVTRFLVEEEVSTNKYKKVNAIRLTCKPGRMPEESSDDVAETLMQIVHLHWLDVVEQAGEVDNSESFKVRFRIVAVKHTEGRKATRLTYSFSYSMDLDEEDREEVASVQQEVMGELLDQSMRANDAKQMYIEHLHETIIDTLKANNQPLSAAGQLLNMAGTMATSGLQATVNALQMQYSTAKVEAEEKGKTARYNAVFGAVSPFIGLGLKQFMESKLGKKVDLNEAMRNMGATPEGEEGDEPSESEVEEDMRSAQQDNPLAFAAKAFGESLSPKQALEMNKKLTKKQVEAIWEVTSADTDDEVKERIVAMQDLFPPAKYPALLAMLDEQQQQLLIHIISGAT